VADGQAHRCDAVHAVLLALEEAIEEAQLEVLAPVRVVRVDVRPGVDHEPLVLGGRARPALEVAAQVQVQRAPVAGRQHRHRDAVEVDVARRMEVVGERMARQLLAPVRPLRAVALRLDLELPPELHEPVRVEAALPRRLAVEVGQPLPGDERGEVRRLQRRDPPAHHRVPRDAARGDLARRPRLRRGPLDHVVEVLGVLRAVEVEHARRLAGPARVGAEDRVAARHPPLGVRRLPHHVLALLDEVVQREALGPVDVLAVRADPGDDRHRLVAVGPEDVGEDRGAVAGRDGDVALDAHQRLLAACAPGVDRGK
jgi:hypothetical protein